MSCEHSHRLDNMAKARAKQLAVRRDNRDKRLDELRDLAGRDGGVSTSEAAAHFRLKRKAITNVFARAMAAGGFYDAIVREHAGCQKRLFASAEKAAAWESDTRSSAIAHNIERKKKDHASAWLRVRDRRRAERVAMIAELAAAGKPIPRLPGEAQEIVMRLAARLYGVSTAEVAESLDITLTSASSRLDAMRKRGHLFATPKFRGDVIRNFTTSAAAAGYVGRPNASRILRAPREPAKKDSRAHRLVKFRSGDGVPGVMVKRTDLVRTGEPIITATTQITRCPSITHDPRYQVDPLMRVVGGFAAAGIGRYLDGVAA